MVIVDLIVRINIKIDSICILHTLLYTLLIICFSMTLSFVLVVCLCAPVLISDKTFEKLNLSSYFFHFPFFQQRKGEMAHRLNLQS